MYSLLEWESIILHIINKKKTTIRLKITSDRRIERDKAGSSIEDIVEERFVGWL